ncbi:MAG: hypothetical protein CL920_20765 [Deltaproteobacteria bacterium]|nr:hypothetical protein [Deltaproteobacteria bacterium]MBU51127.1 hypothetical protein [Deltaproteobacteria bacterium]
MGHLTRWQCAVSGKQLCAYVGILLWLCTCIPCSAHAANFQTYLSEIGLLYTQGQKLASRSMYRKALVKLIAAADLFKRLEQLKLSDQQKKIVSKNRPVVFFAIGKTYYLDKQYNQAAVYFSRCANLNTQHKAIGLARRYLREIWPKVHATIVVSADLQGADVAIKDISGKVYRGQAPWRVQVLSGETHLLVYAEERKPYRATFTLQPGALKRFHVRLRPVTTATRNPIPRVRKQPSSKSNQTLKLIGGICMGAGVVAGATGGILFAFAEGNYAEVNEKKGLVSTDTPGLWDVYSSARVQEQGAIVSFVLAGVLIVGGTALFALPPLSSSNNTPTSCCVPSHNLMGSFVQTFR